MSNPFGHVEQTNPFGGGGAASGASNQGLFGQSVTGSSDSSQNLFSPTASGSTPISGASFGVTQQGIGVTLGANTQTTTSLFGGISSSCTPGNEFGRFTSTQATGTGFGNVASTSPAGSGLGFPSAPASGSRPGNISSTQVQDSLFGERSNIPSSVGFGGISSTHAGSAFGGAAQTKSSVLGFGSSKNEMSPSSGFGSTQTGTSVFGSKTSTVGDVKTGASSFGGSQVTGASAIGGAAQTFSFGCTQTTDASAFGGTKTPRASLFSGAKLAQTFPVDVTQAIIRTSAFSGAATTGSAVFGGTQKMGTSTFGSAAATIGSTVFGGTQKMGSSAFGSAATGSPIFGGTQKTETSFGNSEPAGSIVFGGTPKMRTSTFSGAEATGSLDTQKTQKMTFCGSQATRSTVLSSKQKSGTAVFSGMSKTGTSAFGGAEATGSPAFGATQKIGTSAFGGAQTVVSSRPSGSITTSGVFKAVAVQPVLPSSDIKISRTSKSMNLQSLASGPSAFKPPEKSENDTSSLFGIKTEVKDERTASSQNAVLFGRSVNTKEEKSKPSDGLFGKRDARDTMVDDNSHSPPKKLFGKSRKNLQDPLKDSVSKKLFDKSEHRDVSGKTKSRKHADVAKPTAGLFRKSLSQVVDATKGKKREPGSKNRKKKNEKERKDISTGRTEKDERFSRQSSITEISTRLAIVCKDVPVKYNQHMLLRKHFSQFGVVAKVFPNPKKCSATIHFVDHEAAANAKRNGSILDPGIPRMTIFWGSYGSGSRLNSSRSLEEQPQKRKSRDSLDEEVSSTSKVSKSHPNVWLGSEVNDELTSMLGTKDIDRECLKILDRPKDQSRAQDRQTRGLSPLSSSSGASIKSRSPEKHTKAPSQVSTSVSGKSDNVLVSSLTNAVAHSVGDRMEILEMRDKILRHGRKKQSKLSTASAFIGTCMDMCSEKERYCREERHLLHIYEMSGTETIHGQNPKVDHRRAVKEYSRSSADQEEPMPHELRPVDVLTMTMNYLLTEIADRGQEGKWGDWFDFLWSRTRGIRKDITQQQLCERSSAELLERCTRFHIFCSERLCEEDFSTFDPKINDENLTKCLQTLKEFYHDIESKQHLFCETEAEFRAYMVLMNLNEGDILREVQQLRSDVRNSIPISFAVMIYSALNSNNYVRFFKLVREASFLNACILHRYFTQIRTRALASLEKAYGIGTKGKQYPLDELVHILSFETKKEAGLFCRHFGLVVNEDEVTLLRGALIEPEEAWFPHRAISLVESKQMVSVGEAINGSALPLFVLSEPTCSFDEQGRFIGSSEAPIKGINLHVKRDIMPLQTQKEDVPDSVSTPEMNIKTTKSSKQPYSNETVKEIAREMFLVIINEFCFDVAREMDIEVQLQLEASSQSINDLMVETVDQLARDVASDVLVEETLRKRKMDEEERSVLLDRMAVVLSEELLQNAVRHNCQSLATIEMRNVQAQLKKEQIYRCSIDVAEQTEKSAVDSMIKTLAVDFTRECQEKVEECERIEKSVQLSRIGKFFQLWRKEHQVVCKLKRSMLEFPCSTSMRNPKEQVEMLIPDRNVEKIIEDGFFVSNIARMTIESPMDIAARLSGMSKLLTAHDMYLKLCHEKSWQALDLTNVLMPVIFEDSESINKESNIFFKLLLSLPGVESMGDRETTKTYCNWLKAKFTKGERNKQISVTMGEILSLYRVSLPPTKTGCLKKVGICVRTVQGILTDYDVQQVKKTQQLMGTTGIIFLLQDQPPLTNKVWEQEHDRLKGIIGAKPTNPSCPLVIVLPCSPGVKISEKTLRTRMNIDYFWETGLISNLFIMRIEMSDVITLEASQKLCAALRWLGGNMPPSPELEMKFIRDFIDDFLLEEYYTPVLQNLRYRQAQGYLHQDPNILTQLYNTIIQHLAEVASQLSLVDQSWPVSEFVQNPPQIDMPSVYWNKKSHLHYLYQLLTSLILPEFEYTDEKSEAWSQVCQDVWQFVSRIVDQNPSPIRVDFVSRIRRLLRKTEIDFEETCYLIEGDGGCEPTYINMPWTDLIGACIDYRLMSTNFCDPHFEDVEEELKVVYEEAELKKYESPEYWQHFETSRDLKGATTLNETVLHSAECFRQQPNDVQESVSSETYTYDDSSKSSDMSVCSISDASTVPLLKSSGTLTSMIDEEKLKSKKFEDYLSKVLKDGELDSFDCSAYSPPSCTVQSMKSFSSMENIDVSDHISVTDSTSQVLISERLARLNEMIESNSHANSMFEKRLCSVISENMWENFK